MKDRAADPAEPKGPPPSFAANVLEAERARLKEGEGVEAEREVRVSDASAAEPAPAPEVRADAVGEAREVESSDAAEDRSDAARDDRAEARDAPAPTRSAYGGVKEDAPRMLDVSR